MQGRSNCLQLCAKACQRVFAATLDPYLVVTPDFNITAVNTAYLEATLTRGQDIIGAYMFDVAPPMPAA